jgi:hypothetical protein
LAQAELGCDEPLTSGLASGAEHPRGEARLTNEGRKHMISERLHKLRDAAHTCANCAGCGHTFEPDEPVWRVRVRTGAGYSGGCSMIIAPFCQQCLKPDWAPAVSSGRCEGCGRMAHNTEGYRDHIYCSGVCAKQCEARRHSAIARQQRAEARGPTRICGQCGGRFEPRRADARFCSGVCKQRAYRKRVTVSKNRTGSRL